MHRFATRSIAPTLCVLPLTAVLVACDRTASPPQPSPSPIAVSATVTGVVFDSAFRRVAGATVTLAAEGVSSTVTDGDGAFVLTGKQIPSSGASLTATMNQYRPSSEQLVWPMEGQVVKRNITLNASAPLNLEGEYTMEIIADSLCTQLPPAVRIRRSDTTIKRDSTEGRFTVGMPGKAAQLLTAPGYAQLRVMSDTEEALVERLGADGEVGFDGLPDTRAPGANGMTLRGFAILYCPTTFDGSACVGAPVVGCFDFDNRIVLTRK